MSSLCILRDYVVLSNIDWFGALDLQQVRLNGPLEDSTWEVSLYSTCSTIQHQRHTKVFYENILITNN